MAGGPATARPFPEDAKLVSLRLLSERGSQPDGARIPGENVPRREPNVEQPAVARPRASSMPQEYPVLLLPRPAQPNRIPSKSLKQNHLPASPKMVLLCRFSVTTILPFIFNNLRKHLLWPMSYSSWESACPSATRVGVRRPEFFDNCISRKRARPNSCGPLQNEPIGADHAGPAPVSPAKSFLRAARQRAKNLFFAVRTQEPGAGLHAWLAP
jgi:hypothetical protein